MPLKQHLFLIGPMGAGKSTIGRSLSDDLNCNLVDLDRVIEDRAGASITWIFDIEGESGFRERESLALEHVVGDESTIIATGGGCVLLAENRNVLKRSGLVVYLAASIDQQLERTSKDKNRPLLQTENPSQVLSKMAIERNPLYESVADLVVDTNTKPPKLIIQEIMNFLQDPN